ncbi:MAG: nucleotidyltransferase family protein [Fuerstiella sp.]|nr:nucleotidyltransferase family protein [Fuerstiella sp.]
MSNDIKTLCATDDYSFREIMSLIDRGGIGIALLVDSAGVFLRTITDGDLRRGILAGFDLSTTLQEMPPNEQPSITAPADTPAEKQQWIMRNRGIRHLPLLNDDGTVADLAQATGFVTDQLPMQAVIMAGGFGTRLRPLTDSTPKPMLQIGGKPLMQRTIENLQRAGISRIHVTTHYLPEKITGHFGDGHQFGVDINYVTEEIPMGTAGALRLLNHIDEPLLVINGDILTHVDFGSLSRFHQEHKAALTVAVRQYDVQVPYGVVESTDGVVHSLREKPRFHFQVNAGIYKLEPFACRYIPKSGRYDMTDLIDALLQADETVVGFPITEYWLDIGQHDDFRQAQEDATQQRWAA